MSKLMPVGWGRVLVQGEKLELGREGREEHEHEEEEGGEGGFAHSIARGGSSLYSQEEGRL